MPRMKEVHHYLKRTDITEEDIIKQKVFQKQVTDVNDLFGEEKQKEILWIRTSFSDAEIDEKWKEEYRR